MRDAAEQLCFPNPSVFQPQRCFLEPCPGDKCHHPLGTGHQIPRGAGAGGPGARRGGGEALGEPCCVQRGWQPWGQSQAIALGRTGRCQSIFSTLI